MEENKISKINKKYLVIGIVMATIAIGSIGYVYTKHIVNEGKTELAAKINMQNDTQATSTPISFEMRTFSDLLGTTTLPYITQYENASTTKLINDDMEETHNSIQCFDSKSSKEDLVQTLLEVDDSYKQKDLEKLSKKQLIAIFSKEKDWYSNLDSSNVYAQNDILSFVISEDTYCGGAHPNYGTYGVTYDLKTGKPVALEDLFDNYEENSVQQVFFEYYRKQSDDTECYDVVDPGVEPSSLKYASFYIADKDLVIIPSVSHAETPCQVEAKVPLSSIMSRVKKGSVLTRISLK